MEEQGKINSPAQFETGLSLGGAMVFSFFDVEELRCQIDQSRNQSIILTFTTMQRCLPLND